MESPVARDILWIWARTVPVLGGFDTYVRTMSRIQTGTASSNISQAHDKDAPCYLRVSVNPLADSRLTI